MPAHPEQPCAPPVDAGEGNRLRDELLHALAHDLRNPLSAILGWVDVLTRVGGSQIQGPVEAIRRSVELQDQVLANALDLSSLLRQTLRLERRELAPGRVAQAAVDAARPAAARRRVAIDFEPPGPLPAVQADAARLQQIFLNLCLHALHNTPDGGRLQVALEEESGRVLFRVCDGGRTPTADEQARLAEGLRDPSVGSRAIGSAMVLVRELARLHEAEVRIDRAGTGSRLTVSLPASGNTLRSRGPDISLAGLHVLLVVPAADSRPALVSILAGAGAQVSAPHTTDEALALFETGAPSLVVVDTSTQGEEGRALMRTLRTHRGAGAGLRALALVTAGPAADAAAFSAGFDGCLTMPVKPQKLLTLVAAHAAAARGDTPGLKGVPAAETKNPAGARG